MRLTTTVLASLATVAWLGCGGATSSATPSSSNDAADEAASDEPAPAGTEVRSALRQEAEGACAQACGHIARCAPTAAAAKDCEQDCRDALVQGSGAPAQQYAGCVQALACDAVGRSVTMNEGPLGACYLAALRMAR